MKKIRTKPLVFLILCLTLLCLWLPRHIDKQLTVTIVFDPEKAWTDHSEVIYLKTDGHDLGEGCRLRFAQYDPLVKQLQFCVRCRQGDLPSKLPFSVDGTSYDTYLIVTQNWLWARYESLILENVPPDFKEASLTVHGKTITVSR